MYSDSSSNCFSSSGVRLDLQPCSFRNKSHAQADEQSHLATNPIDLACSLKPNVETGTASSILPIRSRRTRETVTSTPQRSQITPLYLIRLYFPKHIHSHERVQKYADRTNHLALA